MKIAGTVKLITAYTSRRTMGITFSSWRCRIR